MSSTERHLICGACRTGALGVVWVCVAARTPHAGHTYVSLAEAIRRGLPVAVAGEADLAAAPDSDTGIDRGVIPRATLGENGENAGLMDTHPPGGQVVQALSRRGDRDGRSLEEAHGGPQVLGTVEADR